MKVHEYYAEATRLRDIFAAKNKAVDEFYAANSDLLDDATYERFWELQNEATVAGGDWQSFCQSNHGKVER